MDGTQFNLRQPRPSRVFSSLMMWFLVMVGAFLTRLQSPYWVNLTNITLFIPFIVWYLGNTSLIVSLNPVSVILSLSIAVLFLITLTEGFKTTPGISVFSKQLREGYKNYGKDIKSAWLPTLMTMIALTIGLMTTYMITGGNILDMY